MTRGSFLSLPVLWMTIFTRAKVTEIKPSVCLDAFNVKEALRSSFSSPSRDLI